MGYKFKDILKDVQKSNADKDNTGHLKLVQMFQKAAQSKVWSDSLIELYLYNNPIAGVAQAGAFSKKEVAFLKKPENWVGIADTLNEIVENQNNLDLTLYDKLSEYIKGLLKTVKESEGKKNERNPKSAIHRLVFSLLPNLLTTIASETQLNFVCAFIEKCDDQDGIKFPQDYYSKSHALLQLIKKESKEDYDTISPYAWQLREKISELNQFANLLRNNKNIILTGAPGTGKTYLAKEIAKSLGATEDDGNIDFVQFHPSYDYTDFVEGLRPIKKGDTIGFERKDGIFMKFCRKALKDVDNKYVFIIDEINRGELSKILGELFFSIDTGYRGKKGAVSTQYSNLWVDSDQPLFGDSDKFYIPENVYIIGTMNDIDRSVESMDFAMRRRFAFKEVKAKDCQGMIDECPDFKDCADEIKRRMNTLNNKIVKETPLSSAYQIGGAYFLKLKNYLKNGKLASESWQALWDNHLSGLLSEYFRGFPVKEQEIYMQKLKGTVVKTDNGTSQNAMVENGED